MSEFTDNVWTTVSHGRYNFADPSEKQWKVTLHSPLGDISMKFDNDPGIDQWDEPDEILGLFEARLKDYLYYSGKAEVVAKIKAHRERSDEVHLAFYRRKATTLRAQAEKLTEQADKADGLVRFLEQEVLEAAQ